MFCSVVLACLLAHYQLPDVTVPIEYGTTNAVPTVTATMGGRQLRFALDTGCSIPLVLDTASAKGLGIGEKGKETVDAGLPGKMISTPAFDIEGRPTKLHFGAYDYAFATDLHGLTLESAKVDGIIGWPMLSMLSAEFDYMDHQVVFHQSPMDTALLLQYVSLPYEEASDQVYVKLKLPGGDVRLQLDTGRGLSMIATQDRALLKASGSRLWPLQDLYDHTFTERLLTPDVTLGGVELGPAALQLRDRGGLLGNDILRCFRFILDSANHRILLRRRDDKAIPALPGDLRFGVELREGKAIVRLVQPEDGVDLRDGDKLVVLDGVGVDKLKPNALGDRLVGEAGTIAHLVVERDNKNVDVLYKRQSAFDFIKDHLSGKSGIEEMDTKDDGTWVITAMKDGPLWKAGVRPGSLVVGINGKDLKGLSAEESSQLLAPIRTGGCTLAIKSEKGEVRNFTLEKL